MTEQAAMDILGIKRVGETLLRPLPPEGSTASEITWLREDPTRLVSLRGVFTIDELRALIWWMQNKCVKLDGIRGDMVTLR